MTQPNQNDGAWHLDKKVPLALLFAIAIQTSGAMWWASGLSARVEYLERQQAVSAPQAERIIRVETKLEAIGEAITEIKNLIRRQTPPER